MLGGSSLLWRSCSQAFFGSLVDRVYVVFASFSHCPLTVCLWNKEKMYSSSNNEAISLATYQPLLPLLHPNRNNTTQAPRELFVATEEDTAFDPHERRTSSWAWFFSIMVSFITMTHIHWLSLNFFSVRYILLFCFEYWCSTSLTWLCCVCQMVSRR